MDSTGVCDTARVGIGCENSRLRLLQPVNNTLQCSTEASLSETSTAQLTSFPPSLYHVDVFPFIRSFMQRLLIFRLTEGAVLGANAQRSG